MDKVLQDAPLLQVDHISKSFDVHVRGKKEKLHAVRDVSFTLNAGETLGIVGESGCGKSTLGRVVLRLLDATSGQIYFNGSDITHVKGNALRAQRRSMQMVFQDPYASFDPRMDIRTILEEPLRTHHVPKDQWSSMIQEMLDKVNIPTAALTRYPHEFSGGQRQRISIARALLLRPKLVMADEPVAALDVSIQAQILNLMYELQNDYKMGMILVAHNLATVQYISHRIAVMYLGRIVEIADHESLYEHPLHPYTQALISAIPVPIPGTKRGVRRLGGEIPSPIFPPSGCVFRTRCPYARESCAQTVPELVEHSPGHFVACPYVNS